MNRDFNRITEIVHELCQIDKLEEEQKTMESIEQQLREYEELEKKYEASVKSTKELQKARKELCDELEELEKVVASTESGSTEEGSASYRYSDPNKSDDNDGGESLEKYYMPEGEEYEPGEYKANH